MEDIQTVGPGGSGVFLRRATGLVREVGLFDAFVMNTIGMKVVIGTLTMAFTLLWVYSEFAAAMPRSGGDYVFVSRALHPFVGWLMSFSQGAWLIFFWVGFNAWFALVFAVPVSLTTIGA